METNKDISIVQPKITRNVPLCCLFREFGLFSKTNGPPKALQWAAEEKLISRNHEEFSCHFPETTRSTFLMVFSPNGKMIASTHGNHNVYVTDLTNGKHVKTLSGHPRTPWCIAFHPSSNQILASGCLGGQVRVWDLHGGSEIWTAESQTVIASLTFHPTDRVLVIASYNEIHFWDWSQDKPFAKCCTANEREKIRYVAFDNLGHKLVTGIANAPRLQSQWDRVAAPQPPPPFGQSEHERRITICYRYMVEQYEQLVERYYRLSQDHPEFSSGRNLPLTIDRGTDPMETSDVNIRCAVCRRPNHTDDQGHSEAGTSSEARRHRSSTGTDEVSASRSSSQFMLDRSSLNRRPLSVRCNYLYERLARLRNQVETGRTILARTRTAAAALSARMSPSAPEEGSYIINSSDRTPPRAQSPPSVPRLPVPDPVSVPTEDPLSLLFRLRALEDLRGDEPRTTGSNSSPSILPDPVATPTEDPSSLFDRLRALANEPRTAGPYNNNLSDRPSPSPESPLSAPRLPIPDPVLIPVEGTSSLSNRLWSLENRQRNEEPRTAGSYDSSDWTSPRSQSPPSISRFTIPDSSIIPIEGPSSLSDRLWSLENRRRNEATSSYNSNSSDRTSPRPQSPPSIPRLPIPDSAILPIEGPSSLSDRLRSLESRRRNEELRQAGSCHSSDRASPRPQSPPSISRLPSLDSAIMPIEGPSSLSDRLRCLENRRRNEGPRRTDSSSSDVSLPETPDTLEDWQRPLTPPIVSTISPSYSQRISNLNYASTHRVFFDPLPSRPPPVPFSNLDFIGSEETSNDEGRTSRERSDPAFPLVDLNTEEPERGHRRSTSLSSTRSRSEPTNNSDSEADQAFNRIRRNFENTLSHWRVFLRYRCLRDSGSNTEPPSESNSSDSNSSRLRRNAESSSAIARLRAQFRRLQCDYSSRDREPHLLREAVVNAERRLIDRIGSLLDIPPQPPSEPGLPASSQSTPPLSGTDLDSIHVGLQLLNRHIENLSRQCSGVRMESGQMERMWSELQSQIVSLDGELRRDSPPVVRVSPVNPADTEGVASTSSLATDEDSDSSLPSSAARRQLGPVSTSRSRFRFLHRPPWHLGNKRPKVERPFRMPRRNIAGPTDSSTGQGSSPDDDDDSDVQGGGDVERGGQGASSSRAGPSESSDQDSSGRGVKRKARPPLGPPGQRPQPQPSPPQLFSDPPLPSSSSSTSAPSHPSTETPRGSRQRSRTSVTRPRWRNIILPRLWHNCSFRDRGGNNRETSMPRDSQEDTTSPRYRSGNRREAIRNRARHVLVLMVDSLTQFFENDTFTRAIVSENLQDRLTTLINVLNLSLNLTSLLSSQVFSSPRVGEGGGGSSGGRELRMRERRSSGGGRGGEGARGMRDSPLVYEGPGAPRSRPPHLRRVAHEFARRLSRMREDPPTSTLPSSSSNGGPSLRLPVLRVNDGPVPPENPTEPSSRESPPPFPPPVRNMYLHPARYVPLPSFLDDSSEDSPQERTSTDFIRNHGTTLFLNDQCMPPHHRIQVWDFTKYILPEIHLATKNIVVSECKIHNDASVDISNDGKLLVSLLPSGRMSVTTMLGVYSLQWETLGQCLYTTSFDQNAVSVSLSPTTRHLIVGLASRRVHFFHTDRQTIAQIFRLEGGKPSSKGRLVLVRDLEMSREMSDQNSVNCIRWSPTPGEALVYGTNLGKLNILR